MPASVPGPSRSGRSTGRRLLLGVLAFDILVAGLAVWTLVWSRGQYVARAEINTDNLAQVLEQNVLGMVDQIDLALLAIKDEAERQNAKRPGQNPDQDLAPFLQAQMSRIPILSGLRITDADGIIRAGTQMDPRRPLSVQDRDYFQHLAERPEGGLYISRPAVGRVNGKWVVLFARRLDRRDGRFSGVVYGVVNVDALVQTLSELEVGAQGSISLWSSRHELLARFPKSPGTEHLIGTTHVEGDFLESVRSGRHVTHFTGPSRVDGQRRTYTLRRLPTFYILVGLAQADYLQAWRREAVLSSAAALGLITLATALAWLAHRAWAGQLASQAERDRLIGELTLALAEVKHLKGMLPICGQCKKIRDSQGCWIDLESYISDHSDATFSHGVCPDCARDLRDEMRARRMERPQGPDA